MSVDKHLSFNDDAVKGVEVLVMKVMSYDVGMPGNAAVTKVEAIDPDTKVHDWK